MSSNEEDYSSEDDEDYVPEGEASEGDNSDGETEANASNTIVVEEDPIKVKEADKIWESFKADKATSNTPESDKTNSVTKDAKSLQKTTNGCSEKSKPDSKKVETLGKGATKDTVTITKVYDFAGEDVTVTKEVKRESKEAQTHLKQQASSMCKQQNSVGFLKKRPGGGIGSVLGKLGKKPKLSTLEKSKLDWDNYKTEEGIDDELESYKKGKEGYVEKVQFLERTDMRQFHRERDMRLGRSSKR